MHFALFYDYVPDMLERRAPFRADHLALANAYHERGELVMAGAWNDPVDGGLLVFAEANRGEVERFVEQDPYVRNGLVTNYRIREWNVVIGGKAE